MWPLHFPDQQVIVLGVSGHIFLENEELRQKLRKTDTLNEPSTPELFNYSANEVKKHENYSEPLLRPQLHARHGLLLPPGAAALHLCALPLVTSMDALTGKGCNECPSGAAASL